MDEILIGEKIKKLRGQRSINEFAKLCKLSPSTVKNLENDKVNPNLETILKIAEGMNLSIKEIMKIIFNKN